MSKQSLILPSLVSLYGLTVLQSAWLHEDAFITLRSVDNFLAGFGPTWNPGERVQAFTHPLWFVVLTIAVGLTGEVFYTSILLGLAASIAAVLVLVLRLAPSLAHAAVAVALLCSSKAFIDFSTSGLENPLSHLLLALFAAQYFSARCDRRALVLLSFAASLATCTRIDAMLLYVPPLVATAWRLRTASALAALAAGFAPLALWELFSLCYYGFLFPNTAYGKLNTHCEHRFGPTGILLSIQFPARGPPNPICHRRRLRGSLLRPALGPLTPRRWPAALSRIHRHDRR